MREPKMFELRNYIERLVVFTDDYHLLAAHAKLSVDNFCPKDVWDAEVAGWVVAVVIDGHIIYQTNHRG